MTSEAAKAARREYVREYYAKHPDKDEARREYMRQWRKDNQERIKQYNNDYWEKKGAEHEATGSN